MKSHASIITTLSVVFTLLTGCSSSHNLALDNTFPVPLMQKTPLKLALYLDEELLSYTYYEKIDKKGEWNVALGPVQETLFVNLARGVLEDYEVVDGLTSSSMHGVLKPHIDDLQFSLPEQTRSNFYEVWIKYRFQLYDPNGGYVGEWPLPAYGKASKKDFGSSGSGVEAAAIAACRDAMAFFALNFTREPIVKSWLDAGMPPGTAIPPPTEQESEEGADPGTGGEGDSNTSQEEESA